MTERERLVVKNGVYAVAFSLISYLLFFITRRVFVDTLGSVYLGYEGLFSNIFSILSTAEAGMISLLGYALYKSVAEDDTEEISRLMTVHKYYYAFVGIFVLLMGGMIAFFLPNLVTGNTLDWQFVYRIYFIQLFGTGISYFLTYRRTLFTVAQLGYKCTKIDGACTLAASVVKILLLYFTKNYYAYLLAGVAYNIAANIIISIAYKKNFPNIKKARITLKYIKERGFAKKLYDMLLGTVAGKVYGSTDSLVISKFLNIRMSGLYSNYYMITAAVNGIASRMMNGLSPATGNFVNTESKEQIEYLYKMMNMIFYFLSTFIASGYIVLFQPVVIWWLGEEYLLPYSYVICISINEYIGWNHQFIAILRGTQAHFEVDKWMYSLSAITNIVLSILLANIIGITGIVIGTIVGHWFFWIARAYVVHKYIITGKTSRYIFMEVWKFIGMILQVMGIIYITNYITSGLIGIMARGIVLVLYYILLDIVICMISPDGHLVIDYARNHLCKTGHGG